MSIPAKLLARSEAEIQRAILDYLATVSGCVAWRANTGAVSTGERFVRFGPKGQADIIGCYRGRFLACEVKQAGKRPTAEQVAFLAAINQAGGITCVATSVEDVRRALELA